MAMIDPADWYWEPILDKNNNDVNADSANWKEEEEVESWENFIVEGQFDDCDNDWSC